MRLRVLALWLALQTPAVFAVMAFILGAQVLTYVAIGLGIGGVQAIALYWIGTRGLSRWQW
jgi:hypothetical protein